MKVGVIVQHKKRGEIQGTITRLCRKKFELDDSGKCSWLKINFEQIQAKSSVYPRGVPLKKRTAHHNTQSALARLYSCKFLNKHDSKSPTEVWTLHDQKKIYYCKIHIENHIITHGVAYEADVYEYLDKKLKGSVYAAYNFVPLLCVLRKQTLGNLLLLANSSRPEKGDPKTQVSKASCPQENQAVSDVQLARALLASVTREQKPLVTTEDVAAKNLVNKAKKLTYTVVLTERVTFDTLGSDPVTLYEFYKKNNNQTSMLMCILSRLVLSMHKLHQLGVSHNDIHWGNILVRKHHEVDLEYVVEPEGIRLQYEKISVSPVLFDWDWAEMKAASSNTYLRFQNLDPPFSPGRDFSIFFDYWYILTTETNQKRNYKRVTAEIYEKYQSLMRYPKADKKLKERIEKLQDLLLGDDIEEEAWAKEFDEKIDRCKFVIATVYALKSYCDSGKK
jgi:hypothetical protein